jgi:hypothetical protein
MTPEDFAPLEISRYELHLRAEEACNLPAFLGSTLRGAFGHALKQAVCVMPHRDCERCMVADRCIYPYLFETPPPPDLALLRGQQRAPHPFILSPPSPFAPAIDSGSPGSAGVLPGQSLASPSSSVTPGRSDLRIRSSSQSAGIPASVSPRSVAPPILRKAPNALPTMGRANESGGPNGAIGTPSGNGFASDRMRLAPGDKITFGLTLIGRSIEYLPYVVFAVSEMARRGLGFERARFQLTEVHLIDKHDERKLIYSGDSHRIAVPADSATSLAELVRTRLEQITEGGALTPNPQALSPALRLRFVTPTRIRVDGDLQAGMSFELLVRNLLRRVSLLCAVHGTAPLELDYRGLIAEAASVATVKSDLHWCDWDRYSNRQQTKMTLGGFVGKIEYAGQLLDQFQPIVSAGEILHLGGSSAFGLGEYEIAQ